eukprot:CAMPEP_0169294666 /NCGR_PEP_ID=MMETSP1016-20121227/64048_1 /TAXON_ID=342587 /ORGANISM="Karlodinium micrum, Strain CCMP2283" /LENGTH=100 /DNA_ID=CAMNT_0009385645 /DNA_START=264 /DNA_END=566 /DNA_ORIENTATION=+
MTADAGTLQPFNIGQVISHMHHDLRYGVVAVVEIEAQDLQRHHGTSFLAPEHYFIAEGHAKGFAAHGGLVKHIFPCVCHVCLQQLLLNLSERSFHGLTPK